MAEGKLERVQGVIIFSLIALAIAAAVVVEVRNHTRTPPRDGEVPPGQLLLDSLRAEAARLRRESPLQPMTAGRRGQDLELEMEPYHVHLITGAPDSTSAWEDIAGYARGGRPFEPSADAGFLAGYLLVDADTSTGVVELQHMVLPEGSRIQACAISMSHYLFDETAQAYQETLYYENLAGIGARGLELLTDLESLGFDRLGRHRLELSPEALYSTVDSTGNADIFMACEIVGDKHPDVGGFIVLEVTGISGIPAETFETALKNDRADIESR